MKHLLLTALALCATAVAQPTDTAPVVAAFPQDEVTFFGAAQGLPSDNVLGVALREGEVPVALTDAGLAEFREGAWHPGESFGITLSIITGDGRGNVWVGGENGWAQVGKLGKVWRISNKEVVALLPLEQGVVVATKHYLQLFPQVSDVTTFSGASDTSQIYMWSGVTSLANYRDNLLVGTNESLASYRLGRLQQKPGQVFETTVQHVQGVGAMAVSGECLWIGAHDRVITHRRGGGRRFYSGNEGVPFTEFTCAAPAANEGIWFGTTRGAIVYDGTHWFYRAGQRFLPDNHVNGIAVQQDGTAWVATPKGLSRIVRKPLPLAEKAAAYEQIVDQRHRRLGEYIIRCSFSEPGNLESSSLNETDNDGLYTAMYGAAQCFRFAATKDPAAKATAQRAFRALKLLFDATGIPGFPARAIVPTDGSDEDPNIRFDEAYNLAHLKEDPLWKNILPRWPKSADGKWWWKSDTSSDEVAGHYFFYAVYHDFVCDTVEERKEVADVVHAMTKHIVRHNFTLTDHDGKPTRWANWSPEYVNGEHGWADRSLQSVEILSFLNVGLRLTGDKRFAKAAELLRNKHSYHINAIRGRSTWPPSTVVPWDNNLAFLSFYGLIKYEEDPELRKLYLLALDNAWTFSMRNNDPFFNFTYLSLMPEDAQIEGRTDPARERAKALAGAVETLVRTPQLLINWKMENSHRLDVYNDPSPRRGKAYGWLLSGDAVPIEERSHIRINSDHFDLDAGGTGETEYEGTFFLLPYYMGLHYGFIQ